MIVKNNESSFINSYPNSLSAHPVIRIRRLEYVYVDLVISSFYSSRFRVDVVPLFWKAISQSSSILEQTDIAMKSKQPSNSKEDENSKNKQRYNSPFISLESYTPIIIIPHKYPNSLNNNIDIVQRIDAEQPEERLIILAPYAIIQVFTVMVKIACTSIASVAVMTVYVYVFVAYLAK